MEANQDLADAVFLALKPHLGTYSGGDSGPAFWRVHKSFSFVAEGLQEGTRIQGLEAIFGLFPDPSYRAEHEFGDEGMKGILYHGCTLKQWGSGSVMPAYAALIESNPLMTLSSHRQPRQIPSDLNEALLVYIPWQT